MRGMSDNRRARRALLGERWLPGVIARYGLDPPTP